MFLRARVAPPTKIKYIEKFAHEIFLARNICDLR